MSFYDKVYKFEKEENYEEFVDALGLPADKKAFLLNYKPNQKFVKDGDNYTHTDIINGVERSVQFKLGDEFETTLKTTTVKNLYTIDGNTVTHLIKVGADGEVVSTIKKEFDGDKMVETVTNNHHDVAAKRYYSV